MATVSESDSQFEKTGQDNRGLHQTRDGDDAFAVVEQHYMPRVLAEVRKIAASQADARGSNKIDHVDAYRAFEIFFEGRPRLDGNNKSSGTFFIRENMFIIIVASMTIVFGLMGLLPFLLSADTQKLAYKPEIFLDIAKLFAGVVVGGAAGASAARSKSP